MKTIYSERKSEPIFLENMTHASENVLIFPITRGGERNSENWKRVLEFFTESTMNTIVVIDKTEERGATEFFINNFALDGRNLLVLQRSIEDTLFDSVGELVLDDDMWVMQIHDDDSWDGSVNIPKISAPDTVYSFGFYLRSEINGTIEIKDYSMPNRIVFSLVPSKIWNRFSKLVRDQNYHVAGSFDYTLNRMAQLTCKFEYQSGYKYYWKDDNWETKHSAIKHLTKLAVSDGWKDFSSPEIANFNRSIDSLASLNFLKDLLSRKELESEIKQVLNEFRPSLKRKLKYKVLIPILMLQIKSRRIFVKGKGVVDQKTLSLQNQFDLLKFIKRTWGIESIMTLIEVITYIESKGTFDKLENRFRFWRINLAELDEDFSAG